MQSKISGRLKFIFMFHAILGIVLGLGLLLIPSQIGTWLNAAIDADFSYRLIGAAILGFGLSSLLAYRRTSFEQVQLLVETEIAWTFMAALVLLWAGIKLEITPTVLAEQEFMTRFLLYGASLIMGIFFVAFTYCFLTEAETEPIETQERSYAQR